MKKLILIALVVSHHLNAMQMETASKKPTNSCPSIIKACGYLCIAFLAASHSVEARPMGSEARISGYNGAQRKACNELYEDEVQDAMALARLDELASASKEDGDFPEWAVRYKKEIEEREEQRRNCVRRVRKMYENN